MFTAELSGVRETITLDGPGGKERFAVGEPGYRSFVWRVWANRNESSIYVAARHLANVHKWSLHQTGDWRHQWVEEFGKDAVDRTGSRVIDSWPRPPELGAGWTRALTIWVPDTEIIPVPNDDQGRDDVIWIPPAPPGHAWGFHLMIVRPDQGEAEFPPGVPLAAFMLANGESLVVFAQRPPISDESRRWLESWRKVIVPEAGRRGVLADAGAPRVMLSVYDAEGTRMIWDLAAFPRSHRP